MDEKKAKELADSIFDKLNDQELVYLAWINNQKNKEIQELKEENEFLKLNNPEMNIEHSRYVKENKRKIDNLRLVNKRLNNIINELEKWLLEWREMLDCPDFYEEGIIDCINDTLYKIKELKEVINSEKD